MFEMIVVVACGLFMLVLHCGLAMASEVDDRMGM